MRITIVIFMLICQLPRLLQRTLKCGHLFEKSLPLAVKLEKRYAIRQYNTIYVPTIGDKNTIDIRTVYEQNDHDYVIDTVTS